MAGARGAGAAVARQDIEIVIPGEGMPCTVCVVHHMASATPAGEPLMGGPDDADAVVLAVDGTCYQQWGWPVTLHLDQVRLNLDRDVSALAVPIPLSVAVTRILTQRWCAPA